MGLIGLEPPLPQSFAAKVAGEGPRNEAAADGGSWSKEGYFQVGEGRLVCVLMGRIQ